MAAGQASAAEFKLLAGYAHWPLGDLQHEMNHGNWWLVAASSDFILSSVRGERPCPAPSRHIPNRPPANHGSRGLPVWWTSMTNLTSFARQRPARRRLAAVLLFLWV